MTNFRSLAVFLALTAAFAVDGLAGGFQLNEIGARAMGQGGAFAARGWDVSTMFFNPAGLAQQNGFRASVGGTLILPKSTFTSPTGASTDMVSQTFVPPNAYAAYGMENGLQFGVGFFVPFGLGTEWPASWQGRYFAVKTELHDFVLNPTVAYKISDAFMIGGGLSYMWSTVKLGYNIATYSTLAPPTPSATDGSVALDANGHGWGFNLGAIYKPTPALSFGASYRHTTTVDYTGTATFSNMQALSAFFPGGTGTTTIKFPNQIWAGVSYQVSTALSLELDYQWTGWSTFDTLAITLPNGPLFPIPAPHPLQTATKSPKNWKDASMVRVGAEYQANEWAFRLGFIYDITPQPNQYVEPLLPDANRFSGTIGIGYKFAEHWSVDAAYQLTLFNERTVTGPTTGDLNKFPGTYKSSANLFALNLGFMM